VSEFLHALRHTQFMPLAVAAALLASVSAGVVGTFTVVRRLTYVAGGIAHCVFGGIGAAVYLREAHGWTWLHPLHGAVVVALAAAAVIAWVSLRLKEREDTIIGALWAVGMAAGVLFLSRAPGYQQGLADYLFGDILLVRPAHLWMLGILDVAVLLVTLAFYKQFLAVCFDEEFARARGVRTEFYYILLLVLIALTVVLMITVVGIVLLIALLTLPVGIAGRCTRRLGRIMVWAIVLDGVFMVGGLALSYPAYLPSGPTAVVLAGGAYLLTAAGCGLWRRCRKA